MYIALLGRQPELGIAELESIYGSNSVKLFSPESAQIDCEKLNIQKFGGILKAGKIILNINSTDWRDINKAIIDHYVKSWSSSDSKITLGISVYSIRTSSREILKTGLDLKQKLKKSNTSLRLIPNNDLELSTATSHHNKLGLSPNKVELLIIKGKNNQTIVAESTGAQNITAYAKRDQERPKRDAFVGMLPPKLAQIMINLACGKMQNLPIEQKSDITVLDPFCGTGVIIQEAVLMGYSGYGSDLSDKMIDYSKQNLDWLAGNHKHEMKYKFEVGDATDHKWTQPISAVACESYLGQPFSAPPSTAKLNEVMKTCEHIISTFLINLREQISSGTSVCVAIPAWRDKTGNFSHLPLASSVGKYGFKHHEFSNLPQKNLIYCRDDQVVAREILVLEKI